MSSVLTGSTCFQGLHLGLLGQESRNTSLELREDKATLKSLRTYQERGLMMVQENFNTKNICKIHFRKTAVEEVAENLYLTSQSTYPLKKDLMTRG